MSFKKSLEFYNNYIKLASRHKLFLCRADLLFRNYIVPNIDNHKISKLHKNGISFKQYCSYILLALYSIFNILILKIKRIKKAQYLIDIKNSDDFYDFRSKEILEIINPQESANFMHINNVGYSLKTSHKKSNVIYFEALYYALKPFLKTNRFDCVKTDNKFVNNILEIHQANFNDSIHIYRIVKYVLDFLEIDILISLDDSRYSNELNIATKELNIKTIGYMHGRFNEYHLGIFEFPFDKYLVWSSYFKNKLLNLSDKYKEDNIEVVGHFRINKKLPLVKRGKCILWLGESNIEYKEIIPFIKSIVGSGYNIVFRGKPGNENNLSLFLAENKLKIDKSNDYFSSLRNNNIGLVVGTHSTALMESWLVAIPSLALKSNYDYGSHLWEDGLIELCVDENDLIESINKHLNMQDNEILNIKTNIWNSKMYFNKEKVKNILTEI